MRRLRNHWLIGCAGAVTALSIGLSAPANAQVKAAGAKNEAVQVWLTDTTGSSLGPALLTQKPDLHFGSLSSQTPSIAVDTATIYQSILGFGGAMTDAAAYEIYSSPDRDAIMNELFGPGGADFDFIRLPMGASDLSRAEYSYDDMPGGETDPALNSFSVAHDTAYIIPILQQALSIDPHLKILATPWSAPAWMKSGDTFVGDCTGTENYLNPTYYSAYAEYIAKFVQAYEGAYNIPIYMVSMENEPQNCNSGYATMNLDATGPNPNEATLAPYLRSALDAAGYGKVEILGYDHNWYDSDSDPTTYPENLMSSGAPVDAIGYHCYNTPSGVTDPYDAQSVFHDSYPDTAILFTECSGGTWATNQADNLVWEALNNVIGPMRNWAAASDYWTMATDQSNGPNVGGGCTTCRGMVTVNSDGTFTPNEDYYAWAQFSKFVQPDAVRIGSPDLESAGLPNIAFQNPDGSIITVVLNSNSGPTTFHVTSGGRGFSYSLPGSSIVTFKWSPPGGTAGTPPASTKSPTAVPSSTAWYTVMNQNSHACVDAAGWGSVNATVLQQWACGSPTQANQEWQFRPTGSGYDEVVNRNAASDDEAWDVTGGPNATSSGIALQLWSYVGGTNQQWKPVAMGDGELELVAGNSGLCLDVPGASNANGVQLRQYPCNGSAAQLFSLTQQA
jgi:glucosylceramidase